MRGLKVTQLFRMALTAPDGVSFLATGVIALAVYLATMPPNLTLEEAGNFSTAAMYGGVPQAPGYPLWTMLGWAFVNFFPVSNVAWRLGVVSALCAACGCAVMAFIVSNTGKLLLPEGQNSDGDFARPIRLVAGTVTGTLLAFEPALWNRALIAHPWPLTFLLLATVLLLLQKWFLSPARKRFLFAAAFVYGLAVTNSYSLIAAALGLQVLIAIANPKLGRDLFFLNAIGLPILWYSEQSELFGWSTGLYHGADQIGIWIWVSSVVACLTIAIRQRGILSEWRTALSIACLFILGLSIFLYSPIVSMASPPMIWAYPRTTTGFFHLISRGQFCEIRPPPDALAFVRELRIYLRVTAAGLSYAPLLLTIIPVLLWKRVPVLVRPWLCGCLAAHILFVLVLTSVLTPQSDRETILLVDVFYSAPHQFLAIWIGAGIILLSSGLSARFSDARHLNPASGIS